MKTVLKNAKVILPDRILENYDVVFCENEILEIGKNLSAENVINLSGNYLAPGLIDIHTHGGFGSDYMDASDKAFENAIDFQSQNGVTSVLATSVTAPLEDIEKMLEVARSFQTKNTKTRILGAHLEGPWLSLKNKGAQHESFLRKPDKTDIDFVLKNKDVIKRVTVSPEIDGVEEFTRELVQNGITVSGGHDDGYKEKILPVVDAGMNSCTHWYCAMSTASIRDGIRQVGLMELGLLDERLSLEMIADGFHLTTDLLKLAYKNKGADKLCTISDCLRAGGLEDRGEIYTLGKIDDPNAQKFIISKGVARLPDGSRYAGSIQSINQMVKRLICECDVPVCDAFKMASLTPARMIAMDDKIGSIEAGKWADFAVFDENFSVIKTITNGKTVYERID